MTSSRAETTAKRARYPKYVRMAAIAAELRNIAIDSPEMAKGTRNRLHAIATLIDAMNCSSSSEEKK